MVQEAHIQSFRWVFMTPKCWISLLSSDSETQVSSVRSPVALTTHVATAVTNTHTQISVTMSRYVTLYLIFSVMCVTGSQRRPNIVVILTDDQDVTMGGTTPLRAARELIAESGAEFTNAFATTPICCPSRSSVLTGRYLHNTGTLVHCVHSLHCACSDVVVFI